MSYLRTARNVVLAGVIGLVLLLGFAGPVGAHTDVVATVPYNGAVLDNPVQQLIVEFSEPVTLERAGFELLLPTGDIVTPRSRSADAGITWVIDLIEPVAGGVMALRFEAAADDGHLIADGFVFTTPGVATGESGSANTVAFLSGFGGETTATRAAAEIGRFLQIASVLLAIGVLVFATTCLDQPLASEPWLESALASAGMLLVVGAAAEIVGIAASFGLDSNELLTSGRLAAPRLRLVGGSIVAYGGLGGPGLRFAAFAGGTLLATASFGLDGHTATEGARAVMVLANLAHVLAAGVWFGGVASLFLARAPRIPLAARFGSIAAAALVPLFVSGVTMAVIVLDGWGELVGTSWGRALLIKLAAVAAALTLGARHHVSVTRSDSVPLARAMQIELVVMLGIVAATVALLASSPR